MGRPSITLTSAEETGIWNYKLWLNIEVALLAVLIIGVWGLLSLPIIFYHLPISEGTTSGIANTTSPSGGDSICSAPLQYATTGGICVTEFANILTSSNCPPDPEGNILVVRNEEATAAQLIDGLKFIGASDECIRRAVPLLCLHLFGLCGGSGVSIQPTISQCEEVRDTLCQEEWMFVGTLGIDLPDCAIFPADVSPCPSLNDSLSTTDITNTTAASGGDSICSAPLQYATTGGICVTELANILTSSNCPPDPEGNILVVRNEEATSIQLINGLTSIGASDECIRRAVPFLCLHLFGLCGGSGVSIQPTISQCEEVRDTLCQEEWMFVGTLGIDLPDCAMFPVNVSSCPALNDSLSTNEMVSRMMSEPNQTTVALLECSEGFYRENNSIICTPSCYTWLQYSEGLSTFIDVVVFTAAFVGLVSAIAVLVLSFISRKRMLSFPSIFIVYQVTDLLALATFVMVNYMDRNRLSCSSRSLIESLIEVTPFCVISGILFTYVLCQLALWWLFHTVSLFWKVIFPFHARSFDVSGKVKYIHIICVIVGILLPLLPIITSMAKFAMDIRKQNENSTSQIKNDLFLSGGLGFRSSRFPAILCSGRDADVIFYSVVLPIDIILASGCTMLISLLLSVHRQNVKLKATGSGSSSPFKFGTAEKKLLIVFCYYVALAAIALTSFTLSTRNAPLFVKTVQRYFFCEHGGHNPSKPCIRSDFEKLAYPSVSTLSFICLALYPVVNLLYAVNIQELKDLWGKWFKNKLNIFTDTSNTGSSIAMSSTLKREK